VPAARRRQSGRTVTTQRIKIIDITNGIAALAALQPDAIKEGVRAWQTRLSTERTQ